MQNAMNKSETEKNWNSVKSDIKNMDASDLRAVATEIGGKVRDVSSNAYSETVGFLKRYPVSSAIGLAAFGYFLGSLRGRMSR